MLGTVLSRSAAVAKIRRLINNGNLFRTVLEVGKSKVNQARAKRKSFIECHPTGEQEACSDLSPQPSRAGFSRVLGADGSDAVSVLMRSSPSWF